LTAKSITESKQDACRNQAPKPEIPESASRDALAERGRGSASCGSPLSRIPAPRVSDSRTVLTTLDRPGTQ